MISLAIALVAAACGEAVSGDPTDAGDESTTTTAPTSTTAADLTTSDGASALDNMNGPSFPDPLVDPTGRALSGELAGSELDQIHHLDTFWFAWSTYQPGSSLVDA